VSVSVVGVKGREKERKRFREKVWVWDRNSIQKPGEGGLNLTAMRSNNHSQPIIIVESLF